MIAVKQLLFIFGLLCFLFNTDEASAQGTPTVTSANSNTFVTQLGINLGTLIDIPDSDISNFLSTQLIGSTPTLIQAPNTAVTETNDSTIILKWAPVTGATNYKISYISLKNGDIGTSYHPLSSDSIYKIDSIPNDFHLLAIQSYNGSLLSGIDIIILDRVIYRVVFTDQIGCKCPIYENTQILGNFWPYLENGKDFQLRINNKSTNQDLGIIHGRKESNKILFNIDCPDPDFEIIEEGYVLYFFHKQNQITTYIGAFTFAPESFFFSPDHRILFSTCKDSNEEDNDKRRIGVNLLQEKELGIEIFPNPTQDEFTIQFEKKNQEDVLVQLFSASGKLIKETNFEAQETSLYFKEVMNASKLKPGYYFCRITSGKQIEQVPLVKL